MPFTSPTIVKVTLEVEPPAPESDQAFAPCRPVEISRDGGFPVEKNAYAPTGNPVVFPRDPVKFYGIP